MNRTFAIVPLALALTAGLSACSDAREQPVTASPTADASSFTIGGSTTLHAPKGYLVGKNSDTAVTLTKGSTDMIMVQRMDIPEKSRKDDIKTLCESVRASGLKALDPGAKATSKITKVGGKDACQVDVTGTITAKTNAMGQKVTNGAKTPMSAFGGFVKGKTQIGLVFGQHGAAGLKRTTEDSLLTQVAPSVS